MAVNSTRSIVIHNTGDVISDQIFEAADNAVAPGTITIHTLSAGANTITVPVGFTVKGATIIPPAANAQALTLKGIAGDTGIVISNTDPTSIGFQTAPANFVINAGGTVTGLRIVWT